MATLAQLHQTVSAAIAAKRAGTPVFVRLHLQGILPSEPAPFRAALANAASLAGSWLGGDATKLHALHGDKNDPAHAALTLAYPSGARAIVSAASSKSAAPGVQLLLLGNKGACYHNLEGASLFHWQGKQEIPRLRGAAELAGAVEKSLKANGTLIEVQGATKEETVTPEEKKKPAPRYGVLLITGSHTHQENYALFFTGDPRCKVIALTDEKDIDDRRRRLNERLARELGIPYIADLDDALKRDDVNLVCLCAEPDRRGRIALRCAAAGKHLYLDKSLVPQLEEADALREAVARHKIKSHMFSFISQPWAREAKQLVESGKLGKLQAIHADCFFAKGYLGTADLKKRRKEKYPPKNHQVIEAKREFDNVGIYPITLISWLTGKAFQSVYGATENYFFIEHQKHDVEDFGLLAGTLTGGMPVTIAAGRFGWTSHPSGGVNHLLLIGTEGVAVVDMNRPRLEIANDDKPWMPPNVNPDDPMGFWSSTQAAMHLRPKTAWQTFGPVARTDGAYFLDRLDDGKDSELSVKEAAAAAEVLCATYLSAARGEVVSLPMKR